MINFPRKIIFGHNIKTPAVDTVPESQIIPTGDAGKDLTNKNNFVKRYATTFETENKPLPGFTLDLEKSAYTSYSGQWVVIDPRGFSVRITSQNLSKLFEVTGITEGLIQEKCIWSRDNSSMNMFLMPVTDKSYQETVRNTQLIENMISLKGINVGDTVRLQNEFVGKYCGNLNLYGKFEETYNRKEKVHEFSPKILLKRYVFEYMPGKFYITTTPKVIERISLSENILNKSQAAEYVRSFITNGTSYFSANPDPRVWQYGYAGISGIFDVSEKKENVTVELKEIQYGDETFNNIASFMHPHTSAVFMIAEYTNGDYFLINSIIPNDGSARVYPVIFKDNLFKTGSYTRTGMNIKNNPRIKRFLAPIISVNEKNITNP